MSMIELRNPFTGEQVFSVPSETYEAVSSRIAQARAAAREWRKFPAKDRAGLVKAALRYFSEHRDAIAREVTREMGKPVSAAAAEVDYMIERAEFMCRFASDGALAPYGLASYNSEDFEGRIDFVPKGLVYIITPWNYPLFCAINGTVCALLSGSAVLLKHTTTPSVGRHFERAFGSLGGIGSLLVNITVDYDVSARIIETADIDHVVFTGSVQGGRSIQASIAKRAANTLRNPFIGVSLELGSNDAAYIAEDADLASAVEWTVRVGRLHNSGQSCCAVKRVFVHEKLYERFVEAAAQVMAEQRCGDPTAPDTTLGPLFGGDAAVHRLQQLVDDAVAKGATAVTGGRSERIGNALFLLPTLLAGVDPRMAVLREETFGPVLPVMKVKSDAQAIELANDSDYGLSASIFTRSRTRAERFIDASETGTVYVNRCNFVDARLGWIGHKNSGNGSIALSPLGLPAFSNARSVNIDPTLLA
ncbi:aldehyde dehydrogenase family protein [Paraburkholderia diazotrophica]|uniref:Acyl-CoA reductase n=1 Tax=Paraburkholderia diazotrophica TaxID=667676 RepID=A0A1H7DUJ9_9BURK|nr:aldehyde dehydrogenase family protein [Paraburkholderia diazotrophica]SEK05431.1 Acyl-CoA reductase [Paraburkholderia diazotrophica]